MITAKIEPKEDPIPPMKKMVSILDGDDIDNCLRGAIMVTVEPSIRAVIDARDIRATGKLRRSIDSRKAKKHVVEVGSFGVDYGVDVELGRGPHTPDINKLKEWARAKGLDEGIAYPLYKKIKAQGNKPLPHLKEAERAWSRTLPYAIHTEILQEFKNL
jgi:hypothetical protein